MCERILALALLLFSIPTKKVFADNIADKILTVENNDTTKEDNNGFLDSFLDTELNYQAQPQIYVSFYPRHGINFLRSSDKEDKDDFEILNSRNFGGTLAINMPISFYNFFYSIAFDIAHRTLTWKNFKNLHSQSLLSISEYNQILQDDLQKGVAFTNLNFLDFAAMLQLGFKSNIYDHRKGFFFKGMLGVGFQFNENVEIKKNDLLVSIKTHNNVPIRSVKFLWGLEVGYWRIGLSLMGDFLSTLKPEEVSYKGEELDLSRYFHPISLTIFFDIL